MCVGPLDRRQTTAATNRVRLFEGAEDFWIRRMGLTQLYSCSQRYLHVEKYLANPS